MLSLAWYSDISKRSIDSSDLNWIFAKILDSSVLPTPVGPTKRNAAIGPFVLDKPLLYSLKARLTAETAVSWLIKDSWIIFSRLSRFWVSISPARLIGMFIFLSATKITSSAF